MKKFTFILNAFLFFVIGLLCADMFRMPLVYASTLVQRSRLALEERVDALEAEVNSLLNPNNVSRYSPVPGVGGDGPVGARGPAGPAGESGQEGKAGINCWDLDMDRENDPNEDLNRDGRYDVYDCRMPIEPSGPSQPTAPPSINRPTTVAPTVRISRPSQQQHIGQVTELWREAEFTDPRSPNAQREEYVVSQGSSSLWGFQWCADTPSMLQNNISSMRVDIWVNRLYVSSSDVLEYTFAGGECYAWVTHLTNWRGNGVLPLQVTYTLDSDIYDGSYTYQSGSYQRNLDVTIR